MTDKILRQLEKDKVAAQAHYVLVNKMVENATKDLKDIVDAIFDYKAFKK